MLVELLRWTLANVVSFYKEQGSRDPFVLKYIVEVQAQAAAQRSGPGAWLQICHTRPRWLHTNLRIMYIMLNIILFEDNTAVPSAPIHLTSLFNQLALRPAHVPSKWPL